MPENFFKFIKQSYFPIILGLLVLIIAALNYQPGTWLTGWDNLHPEFDFGLNIKRSLFAVWEEYQGLGLLGGMGHASDLPRQIFLWVCSIFLPESFLRYFFTYLMLLAGPLGVYYLISILSTPGESACCQQHAATPGVKTEKGKAVAFLGAMFYLCNLATIQTFYVPFEPFIVQFGLLPWLFYTLIRYLKNPSKKNLLWFFLANIAGLTQAYVPTVFFVWFMMLLVYLGISVVSNKSGILALLKKSGMVILVVLAVNAFWLLPFGYFTLKNSHIPVEAKINQMATEDVWLKNLKYGRLSDVVLLKGFWFDNVDAAEGANHYLMESWRQWSGQTGVLFIGFLIFSLVLTGSWLVLKNGKKEFYPFLVLAGIFLVLLTTATPPFSWFNNFWRDNWPLLNQVFRFPFTKFSIALAFCWSLLFGLGADYLIYKLPKSCRKILFFTFVGLLAFFVFPLFQGELFYSKVKNKIPTEYFSLFKFFRSVDQNTRIANFPQNSFWGWSFYSWGYSGSGFLWYGIGQPILDRAFDVWSREDENYYWEMSRAIYSKDQEAFESVLEKYQINWLVLDENIITAGSPKSLYIDELKEMLANSGKIKKVREFGEIWVYEVNLEAPVRDFVFLTGDLPAVGSEYKWNDEDTAYKETGNYFSEFSIFNFQFSKIYYPFRSLFTGRKQEELEFGIEDKGDYLAFKANLPEELAGQQLVADFQDQDELTIWDENLASSSAVPEVRIEPLANSFTVRGAPSDHLGGVPLARLEVKWPKEKGFYSYDSFDDPAFLTKDVHSCNPFNTGVMKQKIIEGKEGEEGGEKIRFESVGSSNCLDIDLPQLTHKTGYLVKVESRYVQGKQMLFSVVNKNSKRNEIETYLPKDTPGESACCGQQAATPGVVSSSFIIPPMEEDGQGYTLHFDNISIGRQETVNELGRVEVYPIPYNYLKSLKINTRYPLPDPGSGQPASGNFKVEHPNPGFYKVTLPGDFTSEVEDQDTSEVVSLVLSQAYNSGWLAFSLGSGFWNPETYDHLLVNNWENGWKIGSRLNAGSLKPQEERIVYLFYWPQLLEYLGFGLLIGAGVWLAARRK